MALCSELELELIQSHMAQKPVLRGEVGCACVAREVSVERGVFGLRVICWGVNLDLAAGQSTSTSAKVPVGAERTASSKTVKDVVVERSARPSASARSLAGRWGADVGVGGGSCGE